jgi:hypothetical protein
VASWNGDKYAWSKNKEANTYTPGIQCGATEIMTNERLW